MAAAEEARRTAPTKGPRVVFYEQEMAEREKRPLLDVGVHVYYQHPDTGDLVEYPRRSRPERSRRTGNIDVG